MTTTVPPSQWYQGFIPSVDDVKAAFAGSSQLTEAQAYTDSKVASLASQGDISSAVAAAVAPLASTASLAGKVAKTGDTMTGPLSISTAALQTAHNVVQQGSGVANYSTFNAWPHAGFAYNYKLITSDQVALGADAIAAGRGVVVGDAVDMYAGGTSVNGARIAHGAFLTISAPLQAGNNNFFGATWHFAQSVAPVSGSTSGAPAGNLYAVNPQVQLAAGATNYVSVMGGELDVEVDTGASVQYKWGWNVTTAGTDAVHGSVAEAALHIGAVPSSGGWNNGLLFSRFSGNGVPISATGSLISTVTSFGGGWSAQHGIDLRGVTLSGYAFACGPNINSPSFSVSGTGNLNAANAGLSGTLNVAGAVDFGGLATLAGGLILSPTGPPLSSSGNGTIGTVTFDASYLYVCVAANTWKRVALSTW